MCAMQKPEESMKTLFEVSFVVDTKRFGEVLAMLDGKVYNVKHRLLKKETVQDSQESLLMLPAPTEGGAIGRIKSLLTKLKHDGVMVVRTKQVAELTSTNGNYASSIMSQLADEKLVKRVKTGVFQIK